MKIKFKRTLIKTGAGAAAGFLTGGLYGAIAGGVAAGATGGKAKPLKSAAIGAGAGFIGGYAAESFGAKGSGKIAGYTPLSSLAYNWVNKPKPTASKSLTDSTGSGISKSATSTANDKSFWTSLLEHNKNKLAWAGVAPIAPTDTFAAGILGESEAVPVGYMGYGGEGASSLLPIALLGAGIFFLAGAS